MLIKRKKLTSIQGTHGVNVVEINETTKAAQLEVQKAKQEARVIKQEAQNILEESQKKLRDAEEKVTEIINSTNIEAKKIKEKVYQDTLQAAKKETEILKTQARELLKQLFEVKRAALTQAHNEIIKVALDLTEKIIRYKASIDPNVLKTQVIEAVKKATSEAERVKVYVNPVDLKALEESIPDMEKLFPSGVDIVPLISDSVAPGSCIVETKSGQLDATFSAQLTALKELITHLEVKEPEIEIGNDVGNAEVGKVTEQGVATAHELPLQLQVTEEEQEQLKEELLGDEPLISIPTEEETFPFESSKETEAVLINEVDQAELQQELSQQVEIIEPENSPQKKKITIDSNLVERTKEEAEELDEINFEFEEEDAQQEEEVEVIEPKNVLKLKKTSSSEISKIAQEIEESKEWKNLIQEEDE